MSFVPLQTTTKQVTASASTTMAMTNNTVSGSALVVGVVNNAGSANTVTSITDSQGNTYVRVGSTLAGGFAPDTELWYAKNIYGGATTLTVTCSGTPDFGIIAREYPDLSHSSPLDVSTTANVAAGASQTATSPVTKYITELVVLMGGQATTTPGWATGAGMGNLTKIDSIGSSTCSAAMCDKVSSTNGAQTATFNGTSASAEGLVIAVFSSGQAVVQPGNKGLRPHPFSPGLAR